MWCAGVMCVLATTPRRATDESSKSPKLEHMTKKSQKKKHAAKTIKPQFKTQTLERETLTPIQITSTETIMETDGESNEIPETSSDSIYKTAPISTPTSSIVLE